MHKNIGIWVVAIGDGGRGMGEVSGRYRFPVME